MTKPIRLIELFAGYGSQAMALRNIEADFTSYKVVEIDKYAINSYNAVFDTNYKPLDITKIRGSDLKIVDTDKYDYLMTYSFPCTDLSLSGKCAGMTKGSGTRSGLLWEVERLLKEVDNLPQILFMENVPQVHNSKNIADFNMWLEFLSSLGYKNYYKDLNSKDFNVPQSRKRCFMLSFLDDREYEFPKEIPLAKSLDDILEESVEAKYYIDTPKAKELIDEYLSRNKPKIIDDTVSFGEEHTRMYNEYSPSLRATRHGLKTIVAMRGRYKENPNLRISGLPTSQRLEAKEENISNTLTTVQKDNLLLEKEETYRLRNLTPKEYGRLMGVTDADIGKMMSVNSNSQLYKQFGNSIVVSVMEEMFRKLINN